MNTFLTVNSVSDNPGKAYSPSQILSAYKLGSVGDGTGISVAVIDFMGNPYIRSDLEVFSRKFALPYAEVREYGRLPASNFNFSAFIEPVVDTQWVHAVSPRAALKVVRAPAYSEDGAMEAVKAAVSIGSDIVLLTFQTPVTSQLLEQTDIFNADCVFVASAGDYGAQANFPSCVPQCVSVGGTVLDISEDGRRLSEETVWNGTGGGICEHFAIPDYQAAMKGINELTGGKRGVPDVSFLASPEPGFAVYHSSFQGSFGWYSVGGTSVSAAAVAGIIANLLSSDSVIGLERNSINTAFYRLAGGTSYTNPYGKFVDIVSGSNGRYSARQGFDLCTGLGSLVNL